MTLCMAFFSECYFDLVVAMLLFGLLGVMFVVDEYHAAIGVLMAGIMFISMTISVIMFGILPWISCCLWIISG